MVKVGTLAKYIAMAAPDLIEWEPMSSSEKPSTSEPMVLTEILRAFLMDTEEISDVVEGEWLGMNVLTFVSLLESG